MNRYILFAALLIVAAVSCASPSQEDLLARFTRPWRDHPIWHDGQAEVALYEATRTIYGKPRRYSARLYTNKEHASAKSKTKSADGRGRAVFKHHLREDIATENYHYHFSTMCYVGTNDLKSLKLEMGSQEDCGATFKQYVNHAGTCVWRQHSCFPNEGHASGSYPPEKRFVFQDALGLVLRGYPFEHPLAGLDLLVLPDQTTTQHSGPKPVPMRLTFVGRDTLELPVGNVEAYHLRLTTTPADRQDAVVHDYWFAQAAAPPWLHVMVQYQGPAGLTYRLERLERRAYWRR